MSPNLSHSIMKFRISFIKCYRLKYLWSITFIYPRSVELIFLPFSSFLSSHRLWSMASSLVFCRQSLMSWWLIYLYNDNDRCTYSIVFSETCVGNYWLNYFPPCIDYLTWDLYICLIKLSRKETLFLHHRTDHQCFAVHLRLYRPSVFLTIGSAR